MGIYSSESHPVFTLIYLTKSEKDYQIRDLRVGIFANFTLKSLEAIIRATAVLNFFPDNVLIISSQLISFNKIANYVIF